MRFVALFSFYRDYHSKQFRTLLFQIRRLKFRLFLRLVAVIADLIAIIMTAHATPFYTLNIYLALG